MTSTEAKLRRIEEKLEGLEETIEVLAEPKLLRGIKRALDDIAEGRYRDYDDVEQFRATFESKV